jgi:hypothetical protein
MLAHPTANFNRRLASGEAVSTVARDYGCKWDTMARHKKHCMTEQLKTGAKTRAKNIALDLMKCQKEVYEKSMKATKMALGEIDTPATANLSVFGQCIAPATKVMEVLAKLDEKPQVTQINTTNNYDNLSKEELRELVKLTTKIEGSEEGAGEEKPT